MSQHGRVTDNILEMFVINVICILCWTSPITVAARSEA
jgi:hypothetical protein